MKISIEFDPKPGAEMLTPETWVTSIQREFENEWNVKNVKVSLVE